MGQFATYIGIDLGGSRGKTTAVAQLARTTAGLSVTHVHIRRAGAPWTDKNLLAYLTEDVAPENCVVAMNAPLTVPACVRCTLQACPGQENCADPAVSWMREVGKQLVSRAVNVSDRIVVIKNSSTKNTAGLGTTSSGIAEQPQPVPYLHRCTEVWQHYEAAVVPRETLGRGTSLLAARGSHLRRQLRRHGWELNRNLLEVSPRATVEAYFGADKARGYKRDADPWHTRAQIVEAIPALEFAPTSRMSREEVLSNDHAFEALLSAYTAFRWDSDQWDTQRKTLPEDLSTNDGWIWTPQPGDTL